MGGRMLPLTGLAVLRVFAFAPMARQPRPASLYPVPQSATCATGQ